MKRSLVALLLLCVGCGGNARWEQARANYCQELEILSHDVMPELGNLATRPSSSCAILARDLRVIGGRLRGFSALPRALAGARPENQSVEQAGFATSFGEDAIQSYDSADCDAGDSAKAAQQVEQIKTKIASRLDAALASCRAVGWASTLAPH